MFVQFVYSFCAKYLKGHLAPSKQQYGQAAAKALKSTTHVVIVTGDTQNMKKIIVDKACLQVGPPSSSAMMDKLFAVGVHVTMHATMKSASLGKFGTNAACCVQKTKCRKGQKQF